MINSQLASQIELLGYDIDDLMRYADDLPNDYYHDEFIVPFSENSQAFWSSALNEQHVVTLSGNRGSGKTSLCWSYVFELCSSIEDFVVVIAREEYSTVNDTLLNTLSKHILKYPLSDKRNPFVFKQRPSRFYFTETGAKIIFMGLRFPDQLRGLEPNLVWFEEASKIKKPEVLGTAIGSMYGGRGAGDWKVNGRDFYQIILSTNPDRKDNWVYQHQFSSVSLLNEMDLGPDIDIEDLQYNKLWLWFDLVDNPINTDDGITLNKSGNVRRSQLLAGLANQPEHIYKRDGLGEWCSAEGQVYKITEKNVLTEAEIQDKWGLSLNELVISDDWELYRSCDWGNIKPNICLWIAKNKKTDDKLVYREWRKTHCGDDEMPIAIKEYTSNEMIKKTIIDHDEQKQRVLRNHGIASTFALKGKDSLTIGIALVNGGLRRAQEDKEGGLYFLTDNPQRGERGLLCYNDHHSDAKKWPKSTIAEMNRLEFKKDKDEPEDDGDDGSDTIRYLELYFNSKMQLNLPKSFGTIQVHKRT